MKFEREIDIAASPETLWPLLSEGEQIKRWTPEMISDERLTPDPVGVGSASRVRVKEGSREVESSTYAGVPRSNATSARVAIFWLT